jgi:serpin B
MWGVTRAPLSIALIVALAGGCGGTQPASQGRSGSLSPGGIVGTGDVVTAAVSRMRADPADAIRAAEAINDFGLELLRSGTPASDNAVLSPASIALALGLTRPGARGETARQMDEVLRAVAADDHATWLNALEAALGARNGTFQNISNKDAEVILRIANAPFAQRDYPWQAGYLEALATRFGVGVRLVDYMTDFEAARRTINAWVDDQTEERIPELLQQGLLNELTRLVLVNAVYLKAPWFKPFSEEATTDSPFHRLDGSTMTVPTMRGTGGFSYAEGDGWWSVELPYAGRELAMTIIVPDDLGRFEASLDGAAFSEIVGQLEASHLFVWLPKFGIETQLKLKDALSELGMPIAFDADAADFSGMTTAERLFITEVVHQANIDVDEKGTEAAAATAVIAEATSMPAEVKVDRPFLFALRDVPTGTILFLGRVVEPIERG